MAKTAKTTAARRKTARKATAAKAPDKYQHLDCVRIKGSGLVGVVVVIADYFKGAAEYCVQFRDSDGLKVTKYYTADELTPAA